MKKKTFFSYSKSLNFLMCNFHVGYFTKFESSASYNKSKFLSACSKNKYESSFLIFHVFFLNLAATPCSYE